MTPAEKNLEVTIETVFLDNGYKKRASQDYDKSLCLLPDDVINFSNQVLRKKPGFWGKEQAS